MTSFSYTTGQPIDLSPGKGIDFADLSNSFADVKTFLTGANLDATNLAASVFAPYRPVQMESATIQDNLATSAGTYIMYASTANTHILAGSAVGDGSVAIVPIIPNEYVLTGLTPKLRLSVSLATNATAPACNFTFGLYPISSSTNSGGSFVITPGTVVAGSTVTRNAPAASSLFRDSGSDFVFPSSGNYMFGVVLSAATATNSLINIVYNLQMHWV